MTTEEIITELEQLVKQLDNMIERFADYDVKVDSLIKTLSQ